MMAFRRSLNENEKTLRRVFKPAGAFGIITRA
jgi:hypothetical protein